MKITIILISIMILSSGIVLSPSVFAENVPAWIKNNAGWWASEQIPDSAFLLGIQYLINEGIIVIPTTETSESSQSQEVPAWIKNTAGWWAEDKISEVEFVNAIAYLIKHGIITVNDSSSCANDLSEIFGDPITMVQDICELHESSDYSELVPFVEELNFNSLGFRGPEFSEIKPPNTYRIFMVGGSTMFGSGESSDETTIPAILQKMFDSDSFVQKIEVINAGISGGNSDSELRLIEEKLLAFSPDLVVVYDGWNDLRADYPVGYTKDAWEVMCKIGNVYNFDVIVTHQPIAGFGNKKLTQQETVNSLTGEDHHGFQLIAAKSTYDYMGRELLSLQGSCNVVDLRGIFDDVSGPIYWDQGHVSDAGNLILAEKFHEIVNEIIFNKKQTESKFHNILSKYNSPTIISHLLSKIGIDVDYTQIKQNLGIKDKKDGNYFYLKNQLGASEKILVGKDLSKADLLKIDLTGQDLSGANLSGQDGNILDLRKVDLTDTILRSANLSFTNLSGQDLSGKELRGINFHRANLENADLTNITISKVIQVFEPNFTNPKCSHLTDSFLSTIRNEKCSMDVIKNESIRTDFSNANLNGATISLHGTDDLISFVDFSGADMSGIEFLDLKFRGCKFNETNLSNSIMTKTSFIHCDFSNAKLINSEFFVTGFQNVSFFNAKITNGYFVDTLFIDTDFSNADLGGTIFAPELITVGNNVRTCINHEFCD